MQQIYFCANCEAPIGYGDRFCGSCGIVLKWEIQQVPSQEMPLSQDYQSPGQPQTRSRRNTSPEKQPPSDDAVKPISKEISKLMADFFAKLAMHGSR